MFGLGAGELFLILVLALIFIGPKKLPELAKGLGKGLREFNKAKNELVNSMNSDSDDSSENQFDKAQYSNTLSTDAYKQSLDQDRPTESEKLVGVDTKKEAKNDPIND